MRSTHKTRKRKDKQMIAKLVLGGIFGAIFGATAGWFVFDSLASAIGIGCSVAACICGLMIAFSPDDDWL